MKASEAKATADKVKQTSIEEVQLFMENEYSAVLEYVLSVVKESCLSGRYSAMVVSSDLKLRFYNSKHFMDVVGTLNQSVFKKLSENLENLEYRVTQQTNDGNYRLTISW